MGLSQSGSISSHYLNIISDHIMQLSLYQAKSIFNSNKNIEYLELFFFEVNRATSDATVVVAVVAAVVFGDVDVVVVELPAELPRSPPGLTCRLDSSSESLSCGGEGEGGGQTFEYLLKI
jgi:hypothetical protein